MGSKQHRRGATVVFTIVSLTLLIGFASLAIDIGHAYAVKAELQRTADAAALAGAAVLTSEAMLLNDYDPTYDIIDEVQASALNNDAGGHQLQVAAEHVVIGHLDDPTDLTEVINPNVTPLNAVQVTIHRSAELNGKIPTFFASLLGVGSISLKASATAAVEDKFFSFRVPAGGDSPLVPLSVDIGKYEEQLVTGTDEWSWNSNQHEAVNNSDGIREITIYPDFNLNNNGNNGNDGGGDGGGNFGSLNIGVGSQGTQQLGDQIVYGITAQDLIDEIGTANMVFFDDSGNPLTYTITGNPGLSGALAAHVEARLGDVIAFFVHDAVATNGSNAEFTIVGIRFGRVLGVDLTGNPDTKHLLIQPTTYSGGGVQTSSVALSSGGTVFSLRLAR